jgi:hypothetical protein
MNMPEIQGLQFPQKINLNTSIVVDQANVALTGGLSNMRKGGIGKGVVMLV